MESRLSAIHDALVTTLGWRRAPSVAMERASGVPVASNSAARVPGTAVETPSRPFEFGGLQLRLVAASLATDEPDREIPPIVTDTMLRRIVEAHFAVWYVWHVPTGVCIVPGMRELLDIPDEDVPTIVEDWLGRVHPDDLPRMVAENDEALRTNSSFRSEYRFRRGDGTYISISDWGIVLCGDDGAAEWMAGGLRDITVEKSLEQAREEAERLREVLFKHAPVPTFLIDRTGVLADASQSALDFLQVERDAVVGHPALEILPAHLVERTRRPLDAGPAGEDAPGTTEVELVVAGARKWLLATVVPFAAGDGQMAFVLGADITERKRAAEALAASEASLREKTLALEQHNVALRVLIDQRRNDLEERRRILAENMEQLVFPTLDRLADAFSDHAEVALLDVVRQTLNEIAEPLVESPGAILDRSQGLSRREYQVLQLVRAGRTTEEIAQALYLSPTTVTFHRGNIRRKLGLQGSGVRLASRVAVETVSSPQRRPRHDTAGTTACD
jgi:PAS domain S-box-containing protein